MVDKEQYILPLKVSKVLGHGETRETDARTGTWRFVHLAINERAFRFIGLCAQFDYATFDHFVIKVITFPCSLADASKYREATCSRTAKEILIDAGGASMLAERRGQVRSVCAYRELWRCC